MEHLPNFEQNTISSIHILQQESEALTWLIQEKITAIVIQEDSTLTIDSETLETYPQSTVFLYRILDNYGFNYSQCEQILENSTSTGALFYSNTHQLLIDRKTFLVQKREAQDFSSVVIASAGSFTLGKHTLDINEECTSVANRYFQKSEYNLNIQQYIGNALDIIPTLKLEWDLVFIDADKENYSNYFDLVIDRVRSGGWIIADNVLWSGKVINDEKDHETQEIDNYNKKIEKDPRVENILLSVRDGLMVCRKISD